MKAYLITTGTVVHARHRGARLACDLRVGVTCARSVLRRPHGARRRHVRVGVAPASDVRALLTATHVSHENPEASGADRPTRPHRHARCRDVARNRERRQCSSLGRPAGCDVFPGDTWQRVADPTRAGWSKAGLDSVQSMISRMNSSAMVVVEHGRIVYSYGDLTAQSYLASVRKSILSMLYGIEIARGHIDTSKTLAHARHRRRRRAAPAREGGDHPGLVRRPVRRLPHGLVPRRLPLRGAAARIAEARDVSALLQLGLQRPRHDLRAGDEAKHLRRARSRSSRARSSMQDFRRDLQKKEGDSTRSIHPAYPIFLTTRDMARIGLLMLHNGNWNGKQIVPRDWVAKSTGIITPVSQLNPSLIRRDRVGYGYLWWVFDGPWNTGPYEGAYTGIGAIGQFITVIPKLDLVVAHKTIPRRA